jgi:hypothetical protein
MQPTNRRCKSARDYFCQVRFLCRWARSFLRRLCLLILAFRRFFNEPIAKFILPKPQSNSMPSDSITLSGKT